MERPWVRGAGYYRRAEKFTGKGRIFVHEILPTFADFRPSITGSIREAPLLFKLGGHQVTQNHG